MKNLFIFIFLIFSLTSFGELKKNSLTVTDSKVCGVVEDFQVVTYSVESSVPTAKRPSFNGFVSILKLEELNGYISLHSKLNREEHQKVIFAQKSGNKVCLSGYQHSAMEFQDMDLSFEYGAAPEDNYDIKRFSATQVTLPGFEIPRGKSW